MTVPPAKQSDLGVRTASAIVMLAVAGGALWLGGEWWIAFVAAVGVCVWFEWIVLVMLMHPPGFRRHIWRIGGFFYCNFASGTLAIISFPSEGIFAVLQIVGTVIATDIGAYFFGRTIGGPKIAPKISPSKTWAGLLGGMLGASVMLAGLGWGWVSGLCDVYDGLSYEPLLSRLLFDGPCAFVELPSISFFLLHCAVIGSLIAIVAQAGDFFESWMKRRAGVKDSGYLIPGHGGLFDRLDGLLAVCFVLGVILLVSGLWGGA